MENILKEHLHETIQTLIASSELLEKPISEAAMTLVNCLISGGKILVCGPAENQLHADRFATAMLFNGERDRPALPAISLQPTAIGLSPAASEEIFAQQVRAIGSPQDILLIISSHGDCKPCLKTAEAALSCDMKIVALTADTGSEIAGLLGAGDVEIKIPSQNKLCISEIQLSIVNALCKLIEQSIFPVS